MPNSVAESSSCYRFPARDYVSRRPGRYLYFSADAGAGVVVNDAGAEVLEACRQASQAGQAGQAGQLGDIAGRLLPGHQQLVPKVAALIEPFLDAMVAQGFLATSRRAEAAEVASTPAAADKPMLRVVYIHMTDGCNLRCVYCYNAGQREVALQRRVGGKGGELSAAEITGLLDQAAALGAGTAIFTGGEPLLRAETCDLARYARSLGMTTNLLTNGSLIDAHKAADIADAFDAVIVSLDSFVKSEQESMRPGATFESVVNGINQLVAAKVKSVAIRPVVSTTNLKSMPFFPAYAEREFGCDEWSVANCIPNSPEELAQLDRFADAGEYDALMQQFRDSLDEGDGKMAKSEYALEGAGSCGAAGAILSISATGDVFPCQNLHFDEFGGGNIRRQSLRSILEQSPALHAFRTSHGPPFERCGHCALNTVCGSVCRVYEHTFREEQELFFEKMCPMLRADLDGKLWREAEKVAEV